MTRNANAKTLLIAILVAVILAVVIVVAVVPTITVLLLGQNNEDTTAESDSFKLHVNPLDPIIMSVLTSDGDTIYMLGNKTSDGLPQSINEFYIENEERTTYTMISSDGLPASALNNDGLQMDLIWDGNLTMVHISLVLGNGSEQVSVNIDLDEPVDGNFTDFEGTESSGPVKRSAHTARVTQDNMYKQQRIKHQSDSDSQNFANVAVTVESCGQPESDAIFFADI